MKGTHILKSRPLFGLHRHLILWPVEALEILPQVIREPKWCKIWNASKAPTWIHLVFASSNLSMELSEWFLVLLPHLVHGTTLIWEIESCPFLLNSCVYLCSCCRWNLFHDFFSSLYMVNHKWLKGIIISFVHKLISFLFRKTNSSLIIDTGASHNILRVSYVFGSHILWIRSFGSSYFKQCCLVFALLKYLSISSYCYFS